MSYLHNRGFFSIDALFAVTLLLMVSASFLNIYEGRNQEADLVGVRLEAKIVCEELAAAINSVYTNGPVFDLTINLPSTIRSSRYIIRVGNDQRVVTAENLEVGVTQNMARAAIICMNIENVELNFDNLSKPIKVYWENDQVKLVNT